MNPNPNVVIPVAQGHRGVCLALVQTVLMLGGMMVATNLVTTEHGLLLANFVLAAVAAWSAWLSRRGLRQERQAIQGTTRPVIVDVPLRLYMREVSTRMDEPDMGKIRWFRPTSPVSIQLTVPVRNIGAGPAFVWGSWFGAPGYDHVADVDHQVIPADELAVISIEVDTSSTLYPAMARASEEGGMFSVTLSYTDLGKQHYQSVVRMMTASPPGNADVLNVELRRCDKDWKVESDSAVVTGRS